MIRRLSALLLVLILIIIALHLLFQNFYPFPKSIKYGVSFSQKFASDLKLDWKEVYIKILDDLKVRYIRLPTYWDVIEKEPLKYDFSTTDFMLDEAQKRGASIILTLGVRQYRWPECYIPQWAKDLTLGERQKKTLDFIQKVVERYRLHESITSWEVENEPLLEDFGQDCDKPDINFLTKEADLVKSLDKRSIILTDSGELGFWVTSMKLSDIFGTTLYRTVHNRILGFVEYPILPYFYNIKSTIIRSLFAPNNKRTIIVELQGEPWSPSNNLVETPIKQQSASFSINKFKQNINFARQTGFDEMYLWGVEWWYFMAQNGHPEYLDYAKILFLL